ncbi:MAG: hypothetical protein HYW95_02110 [Candidatus Wildermuthbacteria bacterium]|nr:hypothetical protein [Candidatus Wildermuthbacteria bacterium]
MIKFTLVLFVLVSGALFLFGSSASAQNGTLFFSPATGSFAQDDSFWVNVMVNTQGEDVNAVAAYFTYPEDKLEAREINTANSAMTLFAEKKYGQGRVEISGGKPTPGFSGIQQIASVLFRVKSSSGAATLTFASDSAVLTDAGNANILNLVASGKGAYVLKAKSSASSSPTPRPSSSVSPTPTTSSQPAPSSFPTSQPQFSLSDVRVDTITGESARIAWVTSEGANSVVEYGPNKEYAFIVLRGELAMEHQITLENLSPQTEYHFRVKGTNAADKELQSEDQVFTTGALQTQQGKEEKGIFGGRGLFIGGIIGAILMLLMLVMVIARKRGESSLFSQE